jgi:peptide/nickel transport system permease protein
VTRYIVERLIAMLPVLLLVSVLVFSRVLLLPGDAATQLLGDQATPELMARTRANLGLDRPVPERYLLWLGHAVTGDLGRSLRTQQPVSEAVLGRMPATLQLTFLSLVVALVIGIPLGLIAAIHAGTPVDLASTVLMLGGTAMPSFWLGILLVLLFSLGLRILPSSGWVPLVDDPGASLLHSVLPSVTLGLWTGTAVARQTRGSLIQVLAQDFVRTARSKGLPEQRVLLGHALKNGLLPIVTVLGLQLGNLLAGAVVVETIFAIPGIGRLMIDSIFARDFLTVQGCALLIALAVLAANLLTDISYAYLDPRIRYR